MLACFLAVTGFVFCWLSSVTFALPVGRAYEMVSPVYKAGFGALNIEAVSPGGESVAFNSPGAFAGAPAGDTALDYVARREATGWVTSAEMTPSTLAPEFAGRDVSSTLGLIMNLGKPGPNDEAAFQEGLEEDFLLHSTASPDVSENWELAGLALKNLAGTPIVLSYEGANSDLCHLLFSTTGEYENEPALMALVDEALTRITKFMN